MRATLFVFAVLVVLAPSAGGQDVKRGTLVALIGDAKSGAPLEGAEVVVRELRRLARTNSSGQARLTNLEGGNYRVRVRRLGYVAAEAVVHVQSDSVESVFMLEPVVQELDPVSVIRERVPLYLDAFETRRKMGFGRFLREKDLGPEGNRDFTTVAVMRFPGLRQVVDADRRPRLASTRSSCGVETSRLGTGARRATSGTQGEPGAGGSCFSGRPCLLKVFLDDMEMGDDFDLVRTWDLAGVEYYTGASMPPQYRVSGSACGVLVLWSKRGDGQ